MISSTIPSVPDFKSSEVLQFALKWTPRTIVVIFSGYYSLGIAYRFGMMAAIDRISIRILCHFCGYAGIGAFMPTVQWYTAWGVRMVAAIGAGILYDFMEKIALFSLNLLRPHSVHSTQKKEVPKTQLSELSQIPKIRQESLKKKI